MNTEQMREVLQDAVTLFACRCTDSTLRSWLERAEAALTHPQEPARVGGVPEDTEMLDWLQANPGCSITEDGGIWSHDGFECATLRDAVRRAMSTKAGGV